jgi:hypothetical protein
VCAFTCTCARACACVRADVFVRLLMWVWVCVRARAFVDSRALAAGAMWRCRTASAPWAARAGHTSVVDAVSGAIYVIGGSNNRTYYNDVWVSTDGGAWAGLGRGGRGVHQGVLGGL